ncbi:MAG: hypothetical protein Q4A21_02950 [bacterium]|nr:hypothetical protein [bacterium]
MTLLERYNNTFAITKRFSVNAEDKRCSTNFTSFVDSSEEEAVRMTVALSQDGFEVRFYLIKPNQEFLFMIQDGKMYENRNIPSSDMNRYKDFAASAILKVDEAIIKRLARDIEARRLDLIYSIW